MKRLIILTMILGTMSTMAMADAKGGREGQLSFIPKISMGKDVGSGFTDDTFKGINADILYGVTKNFEMGVNIAWVPYGLDMKDTTGVKSYDDTLDTFGLMGVMRYSFNQLDLLTPYVSAKGGWVFGDAKVVSTSDEVEKIEGQWAAGVAAGLEYKNVNLEIGYQMTEFKESTNPGFQKGTTQEELVYVSLGYRFE
ncbi:outer membrane beta-barrel protein [Psychrilyobacter atlanticus]|uniref:outer membrane beta-barrel protein n=1 Tax=Psychrilyobacter atlanticus TaxID=271091 RepID=UPI000414D47A|nr:outer membrane beta-barrel protein [Psychrilyobacter atlanticus]